MNTRATKQLRPLSGLLIGAVAFAVHAAKPVEVQDGVLIDQLGRTIYVFDVDVPGRSSCNGGCAIVWPPLLTGSDDSASEKFGMIVRDDGSSQWTYRGRPLYRYLIDARPGDITGDNRGGVWHALRPGTNLFPAKYPRRWAAGQSYGFTY